VAPWFVHYNLVENISDKNDSYGLAGLFRFKFTKRSAVTFEYGYRLNEYTAETKYYDSMAIGYELETGGHVFQIHFTNSFGIVESQFFPSTDSQWNDMGIRLGFNISRVFTL
jgi:outer membrane protein assembly factor BamA